MLKFLCKLVNLTKSYKRKHKGMFFFWTQCSVLVVVVAYQQPISWHCTEETKPNTTKTNNTRTKA